MSSAVADTSSTRSRASARGQMSRLTRVAAGAGAAMFAFECYVVIRWLTGPNFRRVDAGPSVAPTWIKISIYVGEIAFPTLTLVLAYVIILRPWIRYRRVSFEGLFFVAALVSAPYDGISSYFHSWFVCNALFFNRGNPATSLPGWQSFAEPGAQTPWPMLLVFGMYPVVIVSLAMLGNRLLVMMKTRWPRMGTAPRVAILFAVFILIATPLEAFFFMRLGWYDEALQPAIFSSYWAHDPLPNIFVWGVAFIAFSLLCSRNDRGETIVERGAAMDSSPKSIAIRFFAVFAAVQVILLSCYHIPMTIATLVQPHAHWPSDMSDNSFMNDHICGYGTPRACP